MFQPGCFFISCTTRSLILSSTITSMSLDVARGFFPRSLNNQSSEPLAHCQISTAHAAPSSANHSFAADFLVCYIQWREEPQMSLVEKIQKALVDAMRAKEELRLSVLRGIKAAIQHKEVEKIRPLDEAESIQILQALVKQRKESTDQFTKGNHPQLAAKQTKELAIIESYLPAATSEAEMNAAIAKAIAESAPSSLN